MINKMSILFLATIMLFANASELPAQSDAVAGDHRVKARVNKLGAGAKVTVTFKDGRKVAGSISQILDDSFDVTPNKQTQAIIISYQDVVDVKRRGWSNTAKIAVGISAGVGLTLAALAVLISS